MTVLFRTLCGIDGICALVALYFFMAGLGDGTVSSFNIVLWLGILGGIAVVLGGGVLLKSAGKQGFANLLLLVLAVPAVLSGLVFGLLLLDPPHH